ncbi:hypothetical protein V8G54_003780 [Vigna mungo]|uniref:Tryptophan synthase beta chain-like PALP domain-containing protein n=1 Tax=Vigna mungo TaxID=3915 RepID=A0AAQ3PCD0_VIGMU
MQPHNIIFVLYLSTRDIAAHVQQQFQALCINHIMIFLPSGGDDMMNVLSYLTNILTLKVYDVAIESHLQLAPKLFGKLEVKVWLKREDLQPVFSFKIRGAYNMMAKHPRELLEKGVICSAVIVM